MKRRGKMPKIMADPQEADRRIKICRSCEHFRPKTTQCAQCKCVMRLKTKLKGAKCPIGKW